MKLLKPAWVHHDDKPIFSVDVHQECLKFATGGQGLDSGRVVIWNLLPVLSEKVELDDSVPKMLCQMDNHLACVNCVRWSQNGQMLASGSDDKLVMIWRKSKGPSGVFGTGGIQKNPESWKCAATLRGHSGDVLDLAWSPQDRWLASCSIDNSIIVWDVQAFPAMVAMLKGHTGLVKGVAWDPVGKFLVSQSDDRSVKIWKTSDWTCNSTITKPFEECGGTTHILRLSWSPDGQYLVSAHAMNNGFPTAQIIEREGWKCDKDFVGHRKAVTCVRFHNSILKRQAPKSNKPQQYCCLAMGSRDRSLSVWMTALQRPLVVIHELFNDSILDLSWGPEKCILMACSGDGTVACLQFSEDELGTPLSEEDKNTLYQRIYGKGVTIENGSSGMTDMLIENPELLHISQDKIKPPALPSAGYVEQNNNNSNPNFYQSTASSLPMNGFAGAGAGAAAAAATGATATAGPAATAAMAVTTPTANIRAASKQLETRTADGKRRITPVFIPLNQSVSESTPQSTLYSSPAIESGNLSIKEESSSSCMPRPVITEAEEIRLDSRLIKCTTAEAAVSGNGGVCTVGKMQPHQANKSVVQRFPLAAPSSKSSASPIARPQVAALGTVYQASTTGPKLTITATTKCEFQKTALEQRVHVHNGFVQTSSGFLSKVTAFAMGIPASPEKLWEILVGSAIVNFNFCRKYVMLCSLDGSLRLLSMSTGCTVLPIITLATSAIQCAFCPHGKLVGVITDCGILRIWDIEKGEISLATTCQELLGKFGPIAQFHITENGVPLVLFATGNSYSYSLQLQSWLVLNTKDPIIRYGIHSTLPKEFPKNYHLYPLTSMQASTNLYVSNSHNAAVDLNINDWQTTAKITFIENQIKLCEAINSPEELKHWYAMLIYQLAVGGTETRLRLVLNDLLGSTFPTTSQKEKEHKILSIPKHTLLENALNVLKSHAKWQRIYMEYAELYENCKNVEKLKNYEENGDNTMDNGNGNGNGITVKSDDLTMEIV